MKFFPGIFFERFCKDTLKARFLALGTAHFSARDCTNVLRDCIFVQYCTLKIIYVSRILKLRGGVGGMRIGVHLC